MTYGFEYPSVPKPASTLEPAPPAAADARQGPVHGTCDPAGIVRHSLVPGRHPTSGGA